MSFVIWLTEMGNHGDFLAVASRLFDVHFAIGYAIKGL